MASGASKPVAVGLLIINLILYLIIIIIASWDVNHGIDRSKETVLTWSAIFHSSCEASVLSIPARIFPIYFPMGNMATGFFVFLSLLAGVVGFTTSILGIMNVIQGNTASIHAATGSSLTTWLLTLLAMGFACKEIHIGWTDSNLRTLETLTIIVSGTQLFCTGAIHAGMESIVAHRRATGGRV